MTTLGTWLFALGLVVAWANSAVHVALSDRPLYMMSRRMFEGRVRASRLVAVGVPTIFFLVLVACFVAGVWPEVVALALLLSLFGIRRWEIAQWEGDVVVRLGKYAPAAACLLGWLVTQPVVRALGFSIEEGRRLGWDAACGVLGGAYALAAVSKLRESGIVWAEARYQALLVAERGFSGPAWVRSLRLAVARSPSASRFVGLTGLWVEVLALAFVVPDARVVVLAAVIAVHVGFVVLLGYFEPEWILVMTASAVLARP